MEDGKHRSRKDDSEKKEEGRSRYRDRDREREREKNRDREKDRERNGERHKDRVRARDRDHRRGEREKSSEDKYREKHKDSSRKESESDGRSSRRRDEKERAKEKEREREREERERDEKERARERERDEKERAREKEKEERERTRERDEKERAREKEKEERERTRERDEKERAREKEKEERERTRERDEKERAREKEKEERERTRERERDRERERVRERDKRRDSEDRDTEEMRDHERKRRRREEDPGRERDRDRDRERERSRSDRHKEESEEDGKRRKGVEEIEGKDKKSREERLEEEQRKLDEEMDKRRRRVQEWQELRRKQEESEREKQGAEKAGKNWTLEGEESDDEEAVPDANTDAPPKDSDMNEVVKPATGSDDFMMVDSENGTGTNTNQTEQTNDEEEIDPLDAFMNSMVLPEVEKLNSAVENSAVDIKMDEGENKSLKEVRNSSKEIKKGPKKGMGRILPGEASDSDYEEPEDDEVPLEEEDDDEFMKRVKKTKVEKLSIVDHSKIQYAPFRKNFYIEVKEIFKITSEEVSAYRKQLELKIHGKDVPKPVKTWNQTGLSTKILEVIKKLNFERPMPIQAQALPIIMSGRDCIGIAKTGSGKTLAFVLPMLRHIKDQPPVLPGDGPIGLIMAPTRELVQQIHGDIKKFSKVMGLNCVAVYGGSGVAQQISDLKRGTEIVVCTPGRMIDILCTSGGKITNLRRVTYLVMDEADRMFDMGFEPQITRIVQNTRPDRQTVLFSATFPRQVEILARKVLTKPVEIQVGGRSVVNRDITQRVEVRPEEEKFLRLLELLGEEYEKGKILIFVHSQEKCDSLFKDLLKHGYPCLSLHGAKDQTDRESTISDFKSNVCNLLIATSVAARGLDVKELELVVNFDVPNHYEDYVHRVGRTGRAGRPGKAFTFISEDEARYAPDLVKALELSEQVVPADLKAVADGFMAKVTQGTEHAHGTGYGGSGFKFNEEEDEARKAAKKAQAREYGFEDDKSDSDSEDEGVRKAGADLSQAATFAQVAALAAASKAAITTAPSPATTAPFLPNGGLGALPSLAIPGLQSLPGAAALSVLPNDAAARATALAAAMNLQHNLAKIQADAMPEHYEAELEINDFPQNCRWKVTHKETLGPISEWTGAAITTRGQYFPPGKISGPGERKLYLFIEGPTESSVKKAKAELKRVLEDYTAQALSLPGAGQPGEEADPCMALCKYACLYANGSQVEEKMAVMVVYWALQSISVADVLQASCLSCCKLTGFFSFMSMDVVSVEHVSTAVDAFIICNSAPIEVFCEFFVCSSLLLTFGQVP